MSARELNRDVSAAKRAAASGPVVITDRGEPAYVLLSIEEFHRLTREGGNVVERLRMDEDADVEFVPLPSPFSLRDPQL
ncbi:type II toxin-antitoxin system Phd/YefM family antitoxin [Rothia sp. AR01]|uniref:Antitoxin n=1 Tax=Rothia santali TaxID=2949643 RepID=A0A9X2HIA0_9MICC|nr:type II toxin-antitoxin system prevent-host-death family antitoxin [Rothia santali]MCP3424783.1 type II toxin-antitoxin system Phd/YefM family antitoxin [Rothia santali]